MGTLEKFLENSYILIFLPISSFSDWRDIKHIILVNCFFQKGGTLFNNTREYCISSLEHLPFMHILHWEDIIWSLFFSLMGVVFITRGFIHLILHWEYIFYFHVSFREDFCPVGFSPFLNLWEFALHITWPSIWGSSCIICIMYILPNFHLRVDVGVFIFLPNVAFS